MLADVLGAFSDATGQNALNLAGLMLLLSGAMGGVLTLVWMFRAGREAAQGGWSHAPRVLLLVVAAFLFLILVLGVLYD